MLPVAFTNQSVALLPTIQIASFWQLTRSDLDKFFVVVSIFGLISDFLYVAMSVRSPQKIRIRILDLQMIQYHNIRFFRYSTRSQINQPKTSQMPRFIILRFCRSPVYYRTNGRCVSRFSSSLIGLEKKIGMEWELSSSRFPLKIRSVQKLSQKIMWECDPNDCSSWKGFPI